jgi:hypothetical protein
MNTISRFAVLPALLLPLAAPAFAAVPALPSKIINGADLVAACRASLLRDATAKGRLAATSCDHYLAGMITAVYSATPAGMPTRLTRFGPREDQTVCFHLPRMLKYDEFAKLVVRYEKQHREYDKRPAVELAGEALADKYPCKS